MKKIFFLAIILFCSVVCSAQASKKSVPKIGDTVPNFVMNTILNYSSSKAMLSDFKAKLIIIDFWATWCGPCVAGMKDMEKFKNIFKEKIQILTVSNEAVDRVKLFLKNRPYSLPMAIDEDLKLNTYFKHRSVPHFVILNEDLVIKAITHHEYVDSANIAGLLDGSRTKLPLKADDLSFNPDNSFSNNTNNFLFQSVILPYQQGGPMMSKIDNEGVFANRRVFVMNMHAVGLLQIAYQMPYTRVIDEIENKQAFDYRNLQNRFCYELIVPENMGKRKFEVMQEELKRFFNLKAYFEKRKMKVIMLKKISDTKIQLTTSGQTQSNDFIRFGEGITLVNQPLEKLCSFLENNYMKPVINKTGYIGQYDLDIKWFNEKPEKIKEELAKYGLMLEEGEAEIEVLVVKD